MRDDFDWDSCRGAGFEGAIARADAFMRRAGERPDPRPDTGRAAVALPVDYQIPTFLRRGYRRPE